MPITSKQADLAFALCGLVWFSFEFCGLLVLGSFICSSATVLAFKAKPLDFLVLMPQGGLQAAMEKYTPRTYHDTI